MFYIWNNYKYMYAFYKAKYIFFPNIFFFNI